MRRLIFAALAFAATLASCPIQAQTIAPSGIQLPSTGIVCISNSSGVCDTSITRDSTAGSGNVDIGTGAANSSDGTLRVGNVALTNLSAHGLLVAEGAATLNSLGAGSTGQCLLSNGASADPSFQSCSGVTQVNGSNLTTQTPVNFQDSVATNGITISSTNPSAGNIKFGFAGTLTVPGGGTGLASLSAHRLYVGNGTSAPTAVAAGNLGQVLLSGGSSTDPAFADPIVSQAFVNLFSAVSTTSTQTSALVRIPNFSLTGTVMYTFAGLTGSYTSCGITFKYADSLGNLYPSTVTVSVGGSPSNGTNSQTITSQVPTTASQAEAVWACTGYGTGGTLSVDYIPAPNVPYSVNTAFADAISNTQQAPLSGSGSTTYMPSLPYVYNGTSWDRRRSAGVGNNVASTGLAADVAYGQYNQGSIANISTGNYSTIQTDNRGDLFTTLPSSNLFNAVSATSTQTSGNLKLANNNSMGTLFYTFAGITGSYTGCQISLTFGDSLNNYATTSFTITGITVSNGTSTTFVQPSSAILTAAMMKAVWSCTGYGTGGTLSLDFMPTLNGEGVTLTTSVDSLSNSNFFPLRQNAELVQKTYPYVFNGATWDRARSTGGISSGNSTPGLAATGTFQPYVNLFNAISTTSTQTSSFARIPNFNIAGTAYFTYAGLVGSYTSCSITFKYADSLGNLIASTSVVTNTAPVNGTFSTNIAPAFSAAVSAAQIQAVWLCSGSYGSAGTLTVDFVPLPAGAIDLNGNLKTAIYSGGGALTDAASNTAIVQISSAGVAVTGVSFPYVFNGTNWDRLRAASLSNFPTSQTSTARNSVGAQIVEKGSRWSNFNTSTASVQASLVWAAEASVRHVADCISFSAISSVTPAITAVAVNLRDGATGAGTVVHQWQLIIPAATGQNVAPFSVCGLNIVGTTNTAMTIEFSSAVTNVIESVSLTGYNVN
jgi:hypothetical protein